MRELAEFLGAHAVATLLIAIAAVWLLISAFWILIHRFGRPLQQGAAGLWVVATRSRAAGYLRRFPYVASTTARMLAMFRFFGLHALLSLAVAIAAFTGFVELAEEVGLDEGMARFDHALANSLRAHLSPETLQFFAAVTRLGNFEFLLGLTVVVGVVLCVRRQWRLAVAWGLATGLGGVLNMVLKSIYTRERPLHDHGFATAHGWSFPSGHASGSMIVYGLMGYLLVRHLPRRWHIPIALVTATLIVLVGSSRVFLQVHYLDDVLAGWASAAAWVAMWVAGLEAARWRAHNGGQPSGVGPS